MQYAKAIVPLIGAGIVALLGQFGINSDTSVTDAVGLVVTAVLVYLIPNRKV